MKKLFFVIALGCLIFFLIGSSTTKTSEQNPFMVSMDKTNNSGKPDGNMQWMMVRRTK